MVKNSQALEVETWWRVEKNTITRPLSVMAHLITEDGQPIEVDDGMDAPPLFWQTGDVVVQRHIFTVSCKMHQDLWLRTGVYWLDTFEHWEVDATGDDALFTPLCNTTPSKTS
jgi:hypothetical protein